MANFTRGPDHHRWGGESISYSGLHQWLRRRYVKRECLVCGARDGRLEWALIPGRGNRTFTDGGRLMWGSRSIEDYVPLCCSCHALYGRDGERPCLA